MRQPTLDELWERAETRPERFDRSGLGRLPEPAARYLAHAVAPDTPLAAAVRLRMRGEIRLGAWRPFTAEQVLRRDGEMLWHAAVRWGGLTVRGFDSLHAGEGRMEWKLMGLFPFVRGQGADVTQSAIDRVRGELVWLPSALCGPEVSWSAPDAGHAVARFDLLGEETELALAVGPEGQLRALRYQRWGNPGGGPHRSVPFGGLVEGEQRFDGYTVPCRMRVGWGFNGQSWDSGGEFFRVTLEEARFR